MRSFTIRRAIRNATIGAAFAATLIGTAQMSFAADKINVGALRFTSHSASFIAYEKGYFKDAGLDVEFKFFQAAQPMAVAIASRDVDFGVTAITGGLINLAAKGAVKVVGGALHEEKGIDGSAILVSKAAFEAGLTSPAKLAGRSFGITQTGSSFHYMASRIAAKEGIAMNKIKLRPLQKVGAIIGALKSGQIDSWAIVPHIAKALAKGGSVKIIGWVNDYAPDYQVTTVFTSARERQPEEGPGEALPGGVLEGRGRFQRGAGRQEGRARGRGGHGQADPQIRLCEPALCQGRAVHPQRRDAHQRGCQPERRQRQAPA